MSTYSPGNTRTSYTWRGCNVNEAEQVATIFSVDGSQTANISVLGTESGIVVESCAIHVGGYNGESTSLRAGIWENTDGSLLTSSAATTVAAGDTNAAENTFTLTKKYLPKNNGYLIGFWRDDSDCAYTTLWDIDTGATGQTLYYDDAASSIGTFNKNTSESGKSLVWDLTYTAYKTPTVNMTLTNTAPRTVTASFTGTNGNYGGVYTLQWTQWISDSTGIGANASAATAIGNKSFTFDAAGTYTINFGISYPHGIPGHVISKTITVSDGVSEPQNPVATQILSGARLAWDAPSTGTPTRYRVEHRVGTHPSFTLYSDNVASSPIDMYDLPTTWGQQAEIEFRIAAYDKFGLGPFSRHTDRIYAPTSLYPPEIISVEPGDEQATLFWTHESYDDGFGTWDLDYWDEETGYIIRYTTDGENFTDFVTGSMSKMAIVSGLTNGTTYTFTVVLIRERSGPVEYESGGWTTVPRSTPGPVTNLEVVGNIESAAVSWVPPTDNGGFPIVNYLIQYSSNGSSWTTYPTSFGTNTSVTLQSLVPRSELFFRVAAFNTVGFGPYTATPEKTLIAEAGGRVRVWDGTSWVLAVPRVRNGSTWAYGVAYVWNGTQWVRSTES